MRLIGISILFGIIGYLFLAYIGGETFALLGGIIGFFTPSIFVLEQIYNEIKKTK